MKTSKRGIDLIKSFEGLRLTAYKPVKTEKNFTIGYGHCSPCIREGMMITQELAEQYLKEDLQKFEDGVNSLLSDFLKKGFKLNQNQFDALVSFSYNVGLKNFANSTLLRKVKLVANNPSIRDEFMRWVYSGKTKLAGLERRRKAEADLYFS
ncbi:MAG: lysozyme [Bacteroidales bacterium]|nr:lysozyme [Bacteroidales bacterium]